MLRQVSSHESTSRYSAEESNPIDHPTIPRHDSSREPLRPSSRKSNIRIRSRMSSTDDSHTEGTKSPRLNWSSEQIEECYAIASSLSASLEELVRSHGTDTNTMFEVEPIGTYHGRVNSQSRIITSAIKSERLNGSPDWDSIFETRNGSSSVRIHEDPTSLFSSHARLLLPTMCKTNTLKVVPAYARLGQVLDGWTKKLYSLYDELHPILERIRKVMIKCSRTDRRKVLSELLISYLRKLNPELLPDIEYDAQSKYVSLTYRCYCAFRGFYQSSSLDMTSKAMPNPLSYIRNHENTLYVHDNLVDRICGSLSDISVLRCKLRHDVRDKSSLSHEFGHAVWEEFSALVLRTMDHTEESPLVDSRINDKALRHDISTALSLVRQAMGSYNPNNDGKRNPSLSDNEGSKNTEPDYSQIVFIYLLGCSYFPIGYIKCILQAARNVPETSRKSIENDWDQLSEILTYAYYHLRSLYQLIFSTNLRNSDMAINFSCSYQAFSAFYLEL